MEENTLPFGGVFSYTCVFVWWYFELGSMFPGDSYGVPNTHSALTISLPQRGRASRSGRRGRTRRERNVEMTADAGICNDFTVRLRSGSPSSVIRLAGDRRMPPSPAGGRKGERAASRCRERRPACGRFRSSTEDKPPRSANSEHFFVGRAGVGAPRSRPHVSRNLGRIHKRLRVGNGLAPSGRKRPMSADPGRTRKRTAHSPGLSRVGPCAARKGQALSLQ